MLKRLGTKNVVDALLQICLVSAAVRYTTRTNRLPNLAGLRPKPELVQDCEGKKNLSADSFSDLVAETSARYARHESAWKPKERTVLIPGRYSSDKRKTNHHQADLLATLSVIISNARGLLNQVRKSFIDLFFLNGGSFLLMIVQKKVTEG